MGRIKDRTELREFSWPIHDWLVKNNPDLLEKLLPSTVAVQRDNREKLKNEIVALLEKKEEIRGRHRLFKPMEALFRQDPRWKEVIKKKFPENFRYNSFEKMNRILPKKVSFKAGQKWTGIAGLYCFVHADFGEWTARAEKLMYRAWPEGRTGHPMETSLSRSKNRSRPIINLGTNKIYASVNQASKELGVHRTNISRSIQTNQKWGGYHWAYCDENGKAIKNAKSKRK